MNAFGGRGRGIQVLDATCDSSSMAGDPECVGGIGATVMDVAGAKEVDPKDWWGSLKSAERVEATVEKEMGVMSAKKV